MSSDVNEYEAVTEGDAVMKVDGVTKGNGLTEVDITQLLEQCSLNPNSLYDNDINGFMRLFLLLSYKGPKDPKDPKGPKDPKDSEKLLEGFNMLLRYGVNVYHVDKHKKSVFMHAVIHGDLSIVILISTIINDSKLVHLLDKDKKTALIFAAYHGHFKIVEWLLLSESNVHHPDNIGKTALIYACQHGHIKAAKILLDCGANACHQDREQKTALIYACRHGHTNIAEILLDYGAEINHPDKSGKTALIVASKKGEINTVEYLLSRGANVHYLDNCRKSAIDYATKHKVVYQKLSDAGGVVGYGGHIAKEGHTAKEDHTKLPKPGDAKTKVCINWAGGVCRFGSECKFVHGDAPIVGKETRICKYWMEGHCAFGSLCAFVHESSDGVIHNNVEPISITFKSSHGYRLGIWISIADLFLQQYLFSLKDMHELIECWENKHHKLYEGNSIEAKYLGIRWCCGKIIKDLGGKKYTIKYDENGNEETDVGIERIRNIGGSPILSPILIDIFDFDKIHLFYRDEESLKNFQNFIDSERDNFLKESLQVKKYSKMSREEKKTIKQLCNSANDGQPLRLLARNCKVCLSYKYSILEVSSLCSSNLELFSKNLEDPSEFLKKLDLACGKEVDAYIDVSNIMIGAKLFENDINYDALINPEKIMEIIRGCRDVGRIVAAGTSPERDNLFWNRWGETAEILHYKKITHSDGSKGEQGVDELLHLPILINLTDQAQCNKQRTIILMTGDGNNNSGHSSFPSVVEMILEKTIWNVELWCWKRSMNTIWLTYSNKYSSFSIHYLDDYRNEIVYYRHTKSTKAAFSEVVFGEVVPTKATFDEVASTKSIFDEVAFGEVVSTKVAFNEVVSTKEVFSASADITIASAETPDITIASAKTPDITIEYVIRSLYEFVLNRPERCMAASEFGDFYTAYPNCKQMYQEKAKNKKFYTHSLAKELLLWQDNEAIGGKGQVIAMQTPLEGTSLEQTPLEGPPTKLNNGPLDDVIRTLYAFILGRGGNMDAAALSLFYSAHPECRNLYKAKKKSLYDTTLAKELLLWKDEPTAPGKARVYALVNGCKIDQSAEASSDNPIYPNDSIPMNEKEDFDDVEWYSNDVDPTPKKVTVFIRVAKSDRFTPLGIEITKVTNLTKNSY